MRTGAVIFVVGVALALAAGRATAAPQPCSHHRIERHIHHVPYPRREAKRKVADVGPRRSVHRAAGSGWTIWGARPTDWQTPACWGWKLWGGAGARQIRARGPPRPMLDTNGLLRSGYGCVAIMFISNQPSDRSTMHIDATAAIKRLGIQSNVRFVPRDLTPLLQTKAARDLTLRSGGGQVVSCPAAADGEDPGVIYYDPDTINYAVSKGLKKIGDVEECFAHELVHVAQFEQLGMRKGHCPLPALLELQREQAKPYLDNRFEVEAHELGPWLAPLVKVTL